MFGNQTQSNSVADQGQQAFIKHGYRSFSKSMQIKPFVSSDEISPRRQKSV